VALVLGGTFREFQSAIESLLLVLDMLFGVGHVVLVLDMLSIDFNKIAAKIDIQTCFRCGNFTIFLQFSPHRSSRVELSGFAE
jgi:hypothetical protein